ncbi:polysaccharide deacetylase family protein [Thalassobaculum sp.]|uniref:polysaccharide deacetylase family protein n=1 Tax=Thalassobaculum sp. TaxID=2022740 RepID=UPI003B5B49AB
MFDLTLTFDNGPDPEVTPRVLNILRARGLKATFFVVGSKLEHPDGPALVRAALADGHRIGNHTYTHSIPLGENPAPDLVEAEISRTDRVLREAGAKTRLFRPFGGGGNLDGRLLRRAVVDHLTGEGYSCVLWNAIPRDWADPEGWVETALAQCKAQPWTLIVLHDLPTGAMDRLEEFLDKATALGARFRQDFPDACVPIRDGRITAPVEPYMSDAA